MGSGRNRATAEDRVEPVRAPGGEMSAGEAQSGEAPAGETPAGEARAGEARAGAGGSAWAPLRIRVFRLLWLASLVSNVGSWMHLVAASWLMTSLTASAALVALLQTANSAPGFVLALPAGAFAMCLIAAAWCWPRRRGRCCWPARWGC